MKCIRVIAVCLLVLLLFAACNSQHSTMNIAGKAFIYEKKGAGGDFIIYFGKDGTFNYYEGALSSHIGMGTYTVDGDIVTMTGDKTSRIDPDTGNAESYERTFVFRIGADSITFVADGSDNFTYVKVPDSGRFYLTEIAEE